jgi:serine/threonine protein kinase
MAGDIKPAIVMFADTGEVKLLDFGLAKLLDDSAQPHSAQAATGPAGEVAGPSVVDTVDPGAQADATRVMRAPRVRGRARSTRAVQEWVRSPRRARSWEHRSTMAPEL